MPEKLTDFGKLWAMGYINQAGIRLKACCPEQGVKLKRLDKFKQARVRAIES